jgi:AcrR family transcriptional regulator
MTAMKLQDMSTDQAPAKRKTGRPRAFDEGEAVEIAMHLFWRYGYEGVGVADLTKAVGVAPPSLYGVFGNKANLYRRSLELYSQKFRLVDSGAVGEATSMAEAVSLLLTAAVEIVTSPLGERSCMISSGMLYSHPDHAELAGELGKHRDAIREEIASLLKPWAEPTRLPSVARHLAAVLMGFSIQARDGASKEELLETADDIARSFA